MIDTERAPGQWDPGALKNNADESSFDEHHTPPYGRAPLPTGYWVLSPSLLSSCSAPLLRFLADLGDEFGTTSHNDGSTTISFSYSGRDVSSHVSRRAGIPDRTVDRRLAELRALEGVELEYSDCWDHLTIVLPAVEGSRRPQIPKNTPDVSGRALRCWAALQLAPRDASNRELAEIVGCSTDTISRAHSELVRAGFVAPSERSGKTSKRALVGLVRATPGAPDTHRNSGAQPDSTCRRSGAQPTAEVAPIPLIKQRSDKGPVPERNPGHTRATSHLSDEVARQLIDPDDPSHPDHTPTPRTNSDTARNIDGLTAARAALRQEATT